MAMDWTTAGTIGLAVGGVAPQACIIDWPTTPWQPWVNPHAPTAAPIATQHHTHYHFTPASLSDADVERIAKRVADLLRDPKP